MRLRSSRRAIAIDRPASRADRGRVARFGYTVSYLLRSLKRATRRADLPLMWP